MEAAIAIGACTATTLLAYSSRRFFNTTVNCWFCNQNSKVEWKKRNSFVCPSCQQYNGFDESGDYNKNIPGQARITPTRAPVFCQRGDARKRNQPDLIPDRLGGMHIGRAKSANGLCAECNRNQEIIMNQVRQFEPSNEDRWNEELDELKYKLDRIYPLCAHCTLAVHGKIQADKSKYDYLLKIKNRVKSFIGSKVDRVVNPDKKRSRRHFFSGGTTCETFRVFTLLVAVVSFLAHFDHLQKDAEVDLIWLPQYFQLLTPKIFAFATHLQIILVFAHFIACYNNKCRFTLPDLLLPIISAIYLSSNLVPDDAVYTEDVNICKCACSSFLTILAAATFFIPRKMLHKKRSNRIFSSAFSVASTPVSQCSSQNMTVLDDTRCPSPAQEPESFSPDAERVRMSPESFIRYRERQQTPFNVTMRKSPIERMNNTGDEMDWEDGESVATMQTARTYTSNPIKPSLLASLRSERLRESTPSRELAPSVANISLFGSQASGYAARTPTVRSTARSQAPSFFTSVSRQEPQGTPTASRIGNQSIFGTPKTRGPRSMARSISPPRADSIFTSVSQQRLENNQGSKYQVVIVGLMLLVLFFQVIVLYYMIKK